MSTLPVSELTPGVSFSSNGCTYMVLTITRPSPGLVTVHYLASYGGLVDECQHNYRPTDSFRLVERTGQ